LILAKIISDGTEDKFFFDVFFDSDFKDRTLMRIIAEKEYDILFKGERIDLLLHEIWQGEGTNSCNGNIIDFSALQYLAYSPIKSIKGQDVSLTKMLGLKYNPLIENERYWFQYQFRHTSISYIFLKEFLCCFVMVLFFQYVNLQYLELFKQSNFEGLSGDQLESSIQKNLDEYRSINLIGIILSSTLVGSQ
jgi:hypothetical protein